MKILSTIAIMILISLSATTVSASILDFKTLEIDFTNLADAGVMATWSEPDIVTVTTNGLGWDGEPASLRDGWIRTEPMALGLSWRTPSAISIRAFIQPETEDMLLDNGQIYTPYQGDVYVRYSPDTSNWSTWQVLQQGNPNYAEDTMSSGRIFHGMISIPYIYRQEYQQLLQDFAELDVPWKSDEEAAARWIVENDPDFFERQIPFIGYIEFLYEGSFHGGQRITSFKAEVTYGMSGLHYPPDNDDYGDRDSMPWSFTN